MEIKKCFDVHVIEFLFRSFLVLFLDAFFLPSSHRLEQTNGRYPSLSVFQADAFSSLKLFFVCACVLHRTTTTTAARTLTRIHSFVALCLSLSYTRPQTSTPTKRSSFLLDFPPSSSLSIPHAYFPLLIKPTPIFAHIPTITKSDNAPSTAPTSLPFGP